MSIVFFIFCEICSEFVITIVALYIPAVTIIRNPTSTLLIPRSFITPQRVCLKQQKRDTPRCPFLTTLIKTTQLISITICRDGRGAGSHSSRRMIKGYSVYGYKCLYLTSY